MSKELENTAVGISNEDSLNDTIGECNKRKVLHIEERKKGLIAARIAVGNPFLATSKRNPKRFLHLSRKTMMTK